MNMGQLKGPGLFLFPLSVLPKFKILLLKANETHLGFACLFFKKHFLMPVAQNKLSNVCSLTERLLFPKNRERLQLAACSSLLVSHLLEAKKRDLVRGHEITELWLIHILGNSNRTWGKPPTQGGEKKNHYSLLPVLFGVGSANSLAYPFLLLAKPSAPHLQKQNVKAQREGC